MRHDYKGEIGQERNLIALNLLRGMSITSCRGTAMCRSATPARISITRRHGLGSMLMLLPVLDELHQRGCLIHLCTRSVWIDALKELRSMFQYSKEPLDDSIDLDRMTACSKPCNHRTEQFSEMLGVGRVESQLTISVPNHWTGSWDVPRDSVGLAPEASHPARAWPIYHVRGLAERLECSSTVLLGQHERPPIPADLDLRGKTTLKELFAVVARLKVLVCMDSGLLQMGIALSVPTVAVFGGIDPNYRTRSKDHVIVVKSGRPCSPCNKREKCDGIYPCLGDIHFSVIEKAVLLAPSIDSRQIWTLPHGDE